MSNFKISVIIPVYNARDYLIRCVDSVLAQTFKDFELILVDDGSTDNSGIICDELAKKDYRIRVIHKKNGGANQARYYGVQKSNSQWVTFVDADDTIKPRALDLLYSMHEGADIVVGFINVPQKPIKPVTKDKCIDELLGGQGYPSCPTAKLFNKSLLSFDVFNFSKEIVMGEDLIMNLRILLKTKLSPRFLYKQIYVYNRNITSVSHSIKATIYQEETFYKALYDSFAPAELQKHMHQVIFLKLNGLFRIAYSKPQSLTDKSQPYLAKLISEINTYGYHMSLKEWLIMHCTSALALKCVGFLALAKSSIKYRLTLVFERN